MVHIHSTPSNPHGDATPRTLSVRAEILRVLRRRGRRTWAELASAGLNREATISAGGELTEAGYRVLVGTILLELKEGGG